MSPPPRLLKVACIFPQTKFDLVHSLSGRYLQVTNFLSCPCGFFQGYAATELYVYIFIPLANITAEKKREVLL